VLDREYQIGPITIRPGGKLLTEYLRSEPAELDGVTWFETWPIFAEGTWPGALLAPGGRYAHVGKLSGQDANQRVVAMWLHRIVCLFSLGVGEAWQVRTAAIETTMRPPQVPDDWPPPAIAHGGGGYDLDPVPRALPDWIPAAWDRLEHDADLTAALTSWHQGILLTPLFPSYAMVAFCGAIEGIANSEALRQRIDFETVACSVCGNVPRAHAKFWATVGLVRDPEQVTELKKTINPYNARSKTAHGAATHGVENAFGSAHMMIYSPPFAGQPGTVAMDDQDATQVFMWRDLPTIRTVAAQLLMLALSEVAN
jgi:hypothetical protein